MNNIIKNKLSEIEHTYDVRILYACESGSRAWGFTSPDSDYDVRFIYVHTPEFYLSIDDQRDVIELERDALYDVNGWDLRKALRLFRASNPSIIEWLQSPIIYFKNEPFFNALVNLMPTYYSNKAGLFHYTSQARSCFEKELQGETVRLKKYFYALRPTLAALWIARKQTYPPMDFTPLREMLPQNLETTIDSLLELKTQSDESVRVETIKVLNDFVINNVVNCEQIARDMSHQKTDSEPLDLLFRETLYQTEKAGFQI